MNVDKGARQSRLVRYSFFLVGAGVIGAASLALTSPETLVLPEADGYTHPRVGLYAGTPSCSNSKCHGGEATTQSGQEIGDESIIWEERDPHHNGYKTLQSELSKKIAAALPTPIEDPTGSYRCLSCHAPSVPSGDALLGPTMIKDDGSPKSWKITEGIGCEMCHGPATKWLDPHAEEGWTTRERESREAAGLERDFNLIDTTDPDTRARQCVSCHLQIDKDMVDAKHPPLEFELNSYSNYLWHPDFETHWGDDSQYAGKMLAATLWVTGQNAAATAAATQLNAWEKAGGKEAATALVDLYKRGQKVAIDHLGSLSPGSCAAAAADLAEVATTTKTAAHTNTVALGVFSLCFAAIDGAGAGEESWNALFDQLEPMEKLISELREAPEITPDHRARLTTLLNKMIDVAKKAKGDG